MLKYSILDFISINPDVIFCLKQLFEICWNFDADQFLIWWNLMLFKCWNMSAIEYSKLMHFSEKNSISPIFHLNKTIKLNRLFQMVLKMCEFTYHPCEKKFMTLRTLMNRSWSFMTYSWLVHNWFIKVVHEFYSWIYS